MQYPYYILNNLQILFLNIKNCYYSRFCAQMNVESYLRRRINILTEDERLAVLQQTESLYKQCRELSSDDFQMDDQRQLCIEDNQVTCEKLIFIYKKPIFFIQNFFFLFFEIIIKEF